MFRLSKITELYDFIYQELNCPKYDLLKHLQKIEALNLNDHREIIDVVGYESLELQKVVILIYLDDTESKNYFFSKNEN